MKQALNVEGCRLKVEGLIRTPANIRCIFTLPRTERRFRAAALIKSPSTPVASQSCRVNAAFRRKPSTFNLQPSTLNLLRFGLSFLLVVWTGLPALGAIDELPLSTNGPVGQVGANAYTTPINQW